MKKRILTIFMLLILVLTACGKDEAPVATVEESAEIETTTDYLAEDEYSGTTDSMEEAGDWIIGGVTREAAQSLEFNTLYHGEYSENEIWVSFTTGTLAEAPYMITLENLTVGSEDLYGSLVDAEENYVTAVELVNGSNVNKYSVRAKQDGAADTATFDNLQPDSTYYLRLYGNLKAQYSLRITDNTEAFDVTEGRVSLGKGDVLVPASNLDTAPLLTANVRYQANYQEGSYQWIAFRTGNVEEDPYEITSTVYAVTVDNLTVGSEDLYGYVVDEYGHFKEAANLVNGSNANRYSVRAKEDGTADTAMFDNLDPNTTYFLILSGNSNSVYSVRFTDPTLDAFDTTEERNTIGKGEELVYVANQDDAPILTPNEKYQGVMENGYQWFAFHTRPEKEDLTKITETTYKVTLENLTVGSEDLYGYVVDEYGYFKEAAKLGNGSNANRYSVRAKEDGTADTAEFTDLNPDTTYFLKMKSENEKAAYVVKVTAPDDFAESESNASEAGDEGSESKLFTMASDDVPPGTSQTFALHVPLDSITPAEYTEGFSYLAFTTGESDEAEYNVTLVNRTCGSEDMYGILVDEDGVYKEAASLRNGSNVNKYCLRAKEDGRADTAHYTNLDPDTTYYLKINGNTRAAYDFRVSCISDSHKGKNRTSSNLMDVLEELDEKVELEPGTNQTVAPRLKMNTNYRGKYVDGFSWVSFTTREKKDVEYSVTVENLTVGSEDLLGVLVDEYGDYQEGTLGNGSNVNEISVKAKQDGTADTAFFSDLKPNTTYYFYLRGNSEAAYRIKIGAPKEKKAKKHSKEETIVFKKPLELNHSLIQFKGDLAEFVDPAKVERVLAPVAEIILANPGHKFLLTGTTAWAGDQKEREVLSLNRAIAVKTMLHEKFDVPEDQLLTVGLGFEKDIYFERGRDRDKDNNFIETEAAKNRRVVILDKKHDIAQKILKDVKKK